MNLSRSRVTNMKFIWGGKFMKPIFGSALSIRYQAASIPFTMPQPELGISLLIEKRMCLFQPIKVVNCFSW